MQVFQEPACREPDYETRCGMQIARSRLIKVFVGLCLFLSTLVFVGAPTKKAEALESLVFEMLPTGEIPHDQSFTVRVRGNNNIAARGEGGSGGSFEHNTALIELHNITTGTDATGLLSFYEKTGGMTGNGEGQEGVDRNERFFIYITISGLEPESSYVLRAGAIRPGEGFMQQSSLVNTSLLAEFNFSSAKAIEEEQETITPDPPKPPPDPPKPPQEPIGNGGSGGNGGNSGAGSGNNDDGANGGNATGSAANSEEEQDAPGIVVGDKKTPTKPNNSAKTGERRAAGIGGGFLYAIGFADDAGGKLVPEKSEPSIGLLSGTGQLLTLTIFASCALIGVISGCIAWRRQTRRSDWTNRNP